MSSRCGRRGELNTPRLARITDYVSYWGELRPDNEALVSDAGRWTYRELRNDVDRCAAAMLAVGVRKGDRVALLGHPQPEFFIVFLACASIGAIWVGLSPRHTLPELTRVVEDSEPVLLFGMLSCNDSAQTEKLSKLRERVRHIVTRERAMPGLSDSYDEFVSVALEESRADLGRAKALVGPLDPAAMIYTSGSTGAPKGALVPHRGLAFCGAVQAERWYGDRVRKLCDLPIDHIACLGDICCAVLTAGGTVAFMERFDPAGALRMIERERLTHVYAIPTQLLAIVETPEWHTCKLTSLQRIMWGGAAAPASLLTILSRVGARLATSYSLTESTGSVTYTDDTDPLEVLAWSIGRPDPNYEVRIARPNGHAVDPGEVGEIVIRGDFIMRGYFRDPQATRAAIDEGGWLHTGDLAREEAEGHLRLVGRLKEMFKSGGYNVYPREIEVALESHPAVAIVAVIGVPDERWGEVGHAFVVPRSQVTIEELREFCRSRLANYKVPKVFRIESSLPTLPVGKIDKAALRRCIGA